MTYAGNRVVNANNGVAVVLVLFGVVFFIVNKGDDFPLVMAPIVFLITAAQAFYFETTQDELIVKNYMIPFLNIHYRLNDITQIQFLNAGARSAATARLKIIRGSKRTIIGYQAASLGIKDWQSFVNHLCEKGIPVEIAADSLKSMIGTPEE